MNPRIAVYNATAKNTKGDWFQSVDTGGIE